MTRMEKVENLLYVLAMILVILCMGNFVSIAGDGNVDKYIYMFIISGVLLTIVSIIQANVVEYNRNKYFEDIRNFRRDNV